MTRLQTLIATYQQTRNLSMYYMSLLKETDPYKVFSIDDKALNSLHWIVCHLCWAEAFLTVKSSGGAIDTKDWFEKYAFGTIVPAKEEGPGFEEALDTLKANHLKCIAYMESMTEADLDKDNVLGMAFGKEKSIATMLMHAIRHEGTHAGHLSWLCKLNGVKTV